MGGPVVDGNDDKDRTTEAVVTAFEWLLVGLCHSMEIICALARLVIEGNNSMMTRTRREGPGFEFV